MSLKIFGRDPEILYSRHHHFPAVHRKLSELFMREKYDLIHVWGSDIGFWIANFKKINNIEIPTVLDFCDIYAARQLRVAKQIKKIRSNIHVKRIGGPLHHHKQKPRRSGVCVFTTQLQVGEYSTAILRSILFEARLNSPRSFSLLLRFSSAA